MVLGIGYFILYRNNQSVRLMNTLPKKSPNMTDFKVRYCRALITRSKGNLACSRVVLESEHSGGSMVLSTGYIILYRNNQSVRLMNTLPKKSPNMTDLKVKYRRALIT